MRPPSSYTSAAADTVKDRSFDSDGDQRAREVEPQPARPGQDACATLPAWARYARADPACHLHQAVFALQDPAPPVRLPGRLPEADEDRIWFSYWRHGDGDGAVR